MIPAVTVFTRTFGANSAAKLSVRLMRPALAAAYAATPGDGCIPLVDAMLMMQPPPGCACITSLARWATNSGAMRFNVMIEAWNRGEVPDRNAGGPPPALLTTHVELTEPLGGGVDQYRHRVGVADVGRHEHRVPPPGGRNDSRVLASADHHAGASLEERLGDAAADPAGSTGDEHRPARHVQHVVHAGGCSVSKGRRSGYVPPPDLLSRGPGPGCPSPLVAFLRDPR